MLSPIGGLETMRAALLLIPLAALAAVSVAAGGQDAESMDVSNAAEEAADAAEADAFDMATMGNVTEAAAPRPAWLSGRTWLIAAEAETGAIWYFEALDSDFTRRPYRVLLRTDESGDPASPHDNSERLAEIDCAGHRYRILRTTHYDHAGRATEANERGDGRMVPMAPGSVFAAVEETICRHAGNPGETVTTNGM